MDLFYAIIESRIIGMTWADSHEEAIDQLELALAEHDHYDTQELDVRRFSRTDTSTILDLDES